MRSRVACLAVFVLAMVACSQPADAVIKVWAGSSGNWTTSGNWSPAGVPQDGDDIALIQADAINRTVTYNDTLPFLRIYNTIQIDSQGAGRMTLQQINALTSLEANSISIGGFGPGTYNLSLGASAFGVATLNNGASLNVGSDAFLNVGTLAQNAGSTITAPTTHFNVTTYRYNGGSFNGQVQAGTFIAGGSQFDGFLTINNAMALPVNFTFGSSVITHAPFTHLAGRTIQINSDLVQLGATFNQSGNFTVGGNGFGAIVVGGGGTWHHIAGSSTIGGLQIGTGGTGGTFTIGNGATLSFNHGFSIGLNGDGTFLQTGGRVTASGSLFSRGGEEPVPSRAYWNMSGGTFTHSGDVFLGYPNAISATYIQSNGTFQTARLSVNFDSTTYATMNVNAGVFRVTQSTVNNGSFTASGGTVELGSTLNGAGTITASGTADVSFGRIRQNALSISGNARVTAALPAFNPPPDPVTNRVKSITIEETAGQVKGTFDLARNRLIVDYDGASPLPAIKRYLRSGYNNGSWNGTGINSITASIASPKNKALGYVEASQLFGAAGGVFGDLFADNTSVLIKYTYYGDADLNGLVNFDDYARIDAGFNNGGSDWFHGDFTYDGVVNFDDYALIDLAFNTQGAPLAAAAPVPEPNTLLLTLALAAYAFAGCRRRTTLLST